MRCVLGMAIQQCPPIKTSHAVPEVFHTPCIGILGPALTLGAQPAPEEADTPAQHQQHESSAVLSRRLLGVIQLHLNGLRALQGDASNTV